MTARLSVKSAFYSRCPNRIRQKLNWTSVDFQLKAAHVHWSVICCVNKALIIKMQFYWRSLLLRIQLSFWKFSFSRIVPLQSVWCLATAKRALVILYNCLQRRTAKMALDRDGQRAQKAIYHQRADQSNIFISTSYDYINAILGLVHERVFSLLPKVRKLIWIRKLLPNGLIRLFLYRHAISTCTWWRNANYLPIPYY